MNKKNILIIIASCFFALVIALTIISTSIIKVETGLKNNNPDSISVWHNQIDPAVITKENYSTEYDTIMTAYRQMTSFSLLECVFNNYTINEGEVYQDLSGNHELWNTNKKKNKNLIVVQFSYSAMQEIVVQYNGNKKIARYQYLIFAFDNNSSMQDVSIYLATTSGNFNIEDNSKTYPFVIKAKTSVLFNAMKKVMNF